MHEALFYTTDQKGNVHCNLCSHRCRIKPGKRGICGVRENQSGQLVSLVYGKLIAEHIDPVEKKPLFHFLPGSRTYSISTVGCNFKCAHCQNSEISQYPYLHNNEIAGRSVTAEQVVTSAVEQGCTSISYTYVEPTIFYEFSRDCALPAAEKGIRNIYVSNGYMTPETGKELSGFIDAVNIDIKSFSDSFYKKICKARLQPVLDSVELFYKQGVWVEVTTLVIPGLNDSKEELEKIANFICDISPDIPWHVSAFRPAYKMMDRPSTSPSLLERARDLGSAAGLRYIYLGNVFGNDVNTACHECGENVVYRVNYTVNNNLLVAGKCPRCSAGIPGVWR